MQQSIKKTRKPWDATTKLKNGFYIEVGEVGAKKGMKIRSETRKEMESLAVEYSKYKGVKILGEYKDGIAQ